jgi:hypothetical protein
MSPERCEPRTLVYNSTMARTAMGLLIAALLAGGCGSASTDSKARSGVAQPKYTLPQVTTAFAAQGFHLVKSPAGRPGHFVVLFDPVRTGAFGYQRIGGARPSVTQFLVFLRSGPHFTRRGNVSVYFGDGERPIVKAALRKLVR